MTRAGSKVRMHAQWKIMGCPAQTFDLKAKSVSGPAPRCSRCSSGHTMETYLVEMVALAEMWTLYTADNESRWGRERTVSLSVISCHLVSDLKSDLPRRRDPSGELRD